MDFNHSIAVLFNSPTDQVMLHITPRLRLIYDLTSRRPSYRNSQAPASAKVNFKSEKCLLKGILL